MKARRAGISRHCRVDEARRLCPHLRLVHTATYRRGDAEPQYWPHPRPQTHKVSLDVYRKARLVSVCIVVVSVRGILKRAMDFIASASSPSCAGSLRTFRRPAWTRVRVFFWIQY